MSYISIRLRCTDAYRKLSEPSSSAADTSKLNYSIATVLSELAGSSKALYRDIFFTGGNRNGASALRSADSDAESSGATNDDEDGPSGSRRS